MARSRKQRWIESSAQVDYPQWRILGPDPSFLVRAVVVVVPSRMVLIGIGIGRCCWWDGLDWKRREECVGVTGRVTSISLGLLLGERKNKGRKGIEKNILIKGVHGRLPDLFEYLRGSR